MGFQFQPHLRGHEREGTSRLYLGLQGKKVFVARQVLRLKLQGLYEARVDHHVHETI